MARSKSVMIVKTKLLLNYFFIFIFAIGCVGQGTTGTRSKSIDFSVKTTTTTKGCGTSQYITFSDDYLSYSCGASCETGFHIATATEIQQWNIDAANATNDNPDVKSAQTNSKGICIDDSKSLRPSGEVFVSADFCSCLNGKSDIINDCDSYCASVTSTTTPMLYGNVTLGSLVANNSSFGNLYNWCNAQLASDATSPQCTLTAWDGTNTIENIPVTIGKNANTFKADISSLSYNTTYIVKFIESKSGSNAVSTEFQIRRVKQSTSSETTTGTLKISPISQYSCITYGGSVDTSGNVTRTSHARVFYYFPANETPAPIPQTNVTGQSTIVCHDEISNPGTDNALYPRLELIPSHITMWDKTEPRFVKTNNVMAINATIQNRLLEEYSIAQTVDIFSLINYPNRPGVGTTTSTAIAQGLIMVPFINTTTSKAYCPTSTQYTSNQPLFRVLKDYMGDTEGLYLGEKEAELVQEGTSFKTVYGTMFVNETVLINYGFYVQNGVKIKANTDNLHNKTIYYYWPVNDTMDPLQQGDRKLFTVRYSDQLNGNSPTGLSTSVRPSDKRIGCIPKTTSN
jgi:hypothetical protein